MSRFIIPLMIVLSLSLPPLFAPQAAAVLIEGESHEASTTKNEAAAKDAKAAKPSSHRTVVNVIVDKIEDGAIYARDGRKFEISSSVRVVKNTNRTGKTRTAELIFESQRLVAVTIR